MQKVLNKLGHGVEKQLEYRAVPFSKVCKLSNFYCVYFFDDLHLACTWSFELICNTFHFLLQLKTALNGIVPLVDELREKKMLPAICFNDDRTACEQLAEA